MKILVVDGNSIVNRAFFGIKILTTRDGRYTNAIHGFMNILLGLINDYNPDKVAIAFDVHAPTFRHKIYADYKAGRKGMPDELREQMPVLKELLAALGYRIVEQEGWEADDILGTLSRACTGDDKCYISTGDRDSLQLIGDNSFVLLATSKGTVFYDKNKLMEEYGVEPYQMIELKALQGDASDNIPGIPGVGPKTAGELIKKYGTVEYIYDHFDEIELKGKLREKVKDNKDLAFLSKELGTIRTDAPINLDFDYYTPAPVDTQKALSILTSLEMFKLIEKLGLDKNDFVPAELKSEKTVEIVQDASFDEIHADSLYMCFGYSDGEIVRCAVNDGDKVYIIENGDFGFVGGLSKILGDENCEKTVYDVKPVYEWAFRHNIEIKGRINDTLLAGYILNPAGSDYSPDRLALEYGAVTPRFETDVKEAAFAAVLPSLWEKLGDEITKNDQRHLLDEIEIPFAKVLASMEVTGFLVDKQGIIDYGEKLQKEIDALTDEIYALAGEEFNINSPKQLGEILFVKLRLPAFKKNKKRLFHKRRSARGACRVISDSGKGARIPHPRKA